MISSDKDAVVAAKAYALDNNPKIGELLGVHYVPSHVLPTQRAIYKVSFRGSEQDILSIVVVESSGEVRRFQEL